MREENPKPPSDEGFHLRGGKQNPKPPSDEGFHRRGGKQKRQPPSDEGDGPKGRRERKMFRYFQSFQGIRNILSPSQLR